MVLQKEKADMRIKALSAIADITYENIARNKQTDQCIAADGPRRL